MKIILTIEGEFVSVPVSLFVLDELLIRVRSSLQNLLPQKRLVYRYQLLLGDVRPLDSEQSLIFLCKVTARNLSTQAAKAASRENWSQSLIVIITSWFAIALDEIRTRRILREKGGLHAVYSTTFPKPVYIVRQQQASETMCSSLLFDFIFGLMFRFGKSN